MKVNKLYRLATDKYSMPRTDCYTSKEEALAQLEDYHKNMAMANISTEELFGMWEDKV